MFVINVVVTHAEVDHPVTRIRPGDGIITFMPAVDQLPLGRWWPANVAVGFPGDF